MPLTHALPKLLWRVAIAVACTITAFTARAQTPDANEINQQRDLFKQKAFAICVPPAADPHECRGAAYYAGPFSVSKLSCVDLNKAQPVQDCEMVVEMCAKGPETLVARGTNEPISDAEKLNGLEGRALITLDYSASRLRFMADGVWRAWGDWESHKGPVAVAALVKKDGQWLVSDLRITGRTLSTSSTPSMAEALRGIIGSSQPEADEMFQQPMTIDTVNMKRLSCSQVFAKPEAPRTGDAVTIRRVAVPNPQAPGTCDLPQNTVVSIQSDLPLMGKAKVYVIRLPEGRLDSRCSNPVTINRDDIEAKDPIRALRVPVPTHTVDNNGILKMTPIETTVGSQGLQLRPLPRADYAIAFTVPANTAVIIDAKNPDGWLHVVAKQSKEHWTPTPPFYGWALPGSFHEVQ